MSWVGWTLLFKQKDKKRFDALKPRFLGNLPEQYTLDELIDEAARLAAARLYALWKSQAKTPALKKRALAEHLEKLVPLSKSAAGKLASSILPALQGGVKQYPDNLEDYPEIDDMLAPFIDSFAPVKERKASGLFLTPPAIARMLANGLLSPDADPLEACRLLDSGAATGSLSMAAFRNLYQITPERKRRVAFLLDGWKLVERDEHLARIASLQLLTLLFRLTFRKGEALKAWPVLAGDIFKEITPRAHFTHAISNPPWLGEKHAKKTIRKILQNAPRLKDAYQGKSDTSFFFMVHALLSLKPGGRLSYLTPAYWPTADGAGHFRALLTELSRSAGFIKPPYRIPSAKGIEMIIVNLERLDKRGKAVSKQLNQPDLFGLKEPLLVKGSKEAWRIEESAEETKILNRMAKQSAKLGGKKGNMQIFSGIQTGADKLTKAHIERHDIPGKIGDGIFVLNEEEAKYLKKRANLFERSLIVPLIKSPQCGPFVLDEKDVGHLLYLNEEVQEETIPNILTHLEPYRKILEQRRECREGMMPWWRLHWPRKREIFQTPSILAPQRAAYPRFGLTFEGAFTSVDVYHLKPEPDSPLSIEGWLAILHSAPIRFWLAKRGKRKGVLYELYHTPLANLLVPKRFDEQVASELNRLGYETRWLMALVRRNQTMEKPWHLLWREPMKIDDPNTETLLEKMAEIDALAFEAYGLTKRDAQTIQKAIDPKNS